MVPVKYPMNFNQKPFKSVEVYVKIAVYTILLAKVVHGQALDGHEEFVPEAEVMVKPQDQCPSCPSNIHRRTNDPLMPMPAEPPIDPAMLADPSKMPPGPAITTENLREADALFLTNYLEEGKFAEARAASLVRVNDTEYPELALLNNAEIPTHSGYITVNRTCDSNLFFWYTAAKESPETAPLILWLPGGSGLFSLFLEHGPWFVDSHLKLYARYHDWSRTHGMLYVDNPVGIGFSFTGNDNCYATNQEDIARDLYSFIQQFLAIFPEMRSRALYIMGESYGGKYATSLAHKILIENRFVQPELRVNLTGLGLGNGFCDPINMIHWGDFLFTIGMAGYEERDRFRELAQAARIQIRREKWTLAARLIDTILGGVMTPGHTSLFNNVTNFNYYFNFRLPKEPKEFSYYFHFLDAPAVRQAIHVGKTVYHNSRKVQAKIFPDMAKSVKDKVEDILNNGLKVLVYNGMLDIAVAYPLTETFVDNLEWSHKEGFAASPRWQWKFGTEMAGYVREYKNLGLILVRNAGHLVPFDQPVLGYDLINRFTSAKMFK